MALPLIDVPHFDQTTTDANLAKLRAVRDSLIAAGTVNMDPEERQKYGAVKEQRKLLINKARDYRTSNPEMANPKVDWNRFEKTYNSRTQTAAYRAVLRQILELIDEPEILHDNNNDQQALSDYNYAKYQAEQGEAGYEAKYEDMKQFFTSGE